MSRARVLDRFGAFIAGAAVFAGYLFLRLPQPFPAGSYHDDGVYTSLGRALASGAGYRSIYTVGDPVQLKYPPGLPLVLSLLWRFTGTLDGVVSLTWMLNALLAGVAAALVWHVGRRRMGLHPLTVGVFALGPFLLDDMLQYYSLALSEPWMIAGWALTACLWLEATGRGEGRARLRLVLAAAFVAGATTLFRSHAMALIPAIVVAGLLARLRRREVALAAVVAILPELVWLAVRSHLRAVGPVSTLPEDLPYLDWMVAGPAGAAAVVGRSLLYNLATYRVIFSYYLSPDPAVGTLVLLGVLALAALGAWRSASDVRRSGGGFIALSTGFVLVLGLIWPFTQDRLVLPAFPFLGLLAARGASVLGRRAADAVERRRGSAPPRAVVRAAGLVCVALAAGLVALRQASIRSDYVDAFRTGRRVRQANVGIILLNNGRFVVRSAEWLMENTPRDAVVLVDYPPGIALYSGRKAIDSAPSETSFAPSVFAVPGRYVATRILQDGVSVIMLAGTEPMLQRDLVLLMRRCPGVLERRAGPRITAGPPPPVFLVHPDTACLRGLTTNAPS